jgi:hypothetical protein
LILVKVNGIEATSFTHTRQADVAEDSPPKSHEGEISDDDSMPGMKIDALVVLDFPANLLQRLVDILARPIF